jgi:hypothetical protein
MDIIGHRFIDWAESYFENEDDPHLNRRIPRRDMEANYKKGLTQQELKYFTPIQFWNKLLAFCQWKGYRLNPQKFHPQTGEPLCVDKNGIPDTRDKDHGVEYYTVGNNKSSDDLKKGGPQ